MVDIPSQVTPAGSGRMGTAPVGNTSFTEGLYMFMKPYKPGVFEI